MYVPAAVGFVELHVLSPDCNEKTLSNIIFNDGYAETLEDADFIASVLIQRQNELGRLPSLYTLQKRAFGQVPADTAAIKKRLLSKLDISYSILGQNDTVFSFSKDSIRSGGKAKMTVVVTAPGKMTELIPSDLVE